MMTTVLRGLGIGIAVAGLADPAWTRSAKVRQPLAIVVVEAKTGDSSAVSSRLWAATDRLRSALDADFSLSVRSYARKTAGSVCPTWGGCVIVSDGSIPLNLSAGAAVIGGLEIPRDAEGRLPGPAGHTERSLRHVHTRRARFSPRNPRPTLSGWA